MEGSAPRPDPPLRPGDPEREAVPAGGAGPASSGTEAVALRPAAFAIGVALAVGLLVRAHGLARQVLIDDEFHAFRAGLRPDLGAAYLFTHNALPEDPLSDFSSPLALWVRLLAATVGISEWTLRAPMLLASLGVAGVLAAVAWRAVGRRAAVLVTVLAALSPMLVLYGRFARPYALVALAGAVALAAAARFRERAAPGAALALGASVALGAWMSASALPGLGVLALLGFAPALRGRRGEAARRAAAIGIAVGAALGFALVGPSAEALARFAQAKAGAGAAAGAWWGAAQAIAGSRSAVAVAAFAAFAVAGAALGLRRAPVVVSMAVAALVAQLGAFAILRPHGAHEPLVVARYAIAALPGVLLLVAVGIDELIGRLPRRAAPLVAAAIVVAGVAAGPLPTVHGRENAFTSHPSTLVGPFHAIERSAVPGVYAELDRDPPGAIVEAPWTLEWPLTLAADYQGLHRRPVRVWTGFWTFQQPGVRLYAHVGARDGVPDLRGAERVLVHRDWVAEWRAVTGGPPSIPPDRVAEAAARYRTDAKAIDGWLAARPDAWQLEYEDRFVRAYRRVDGRVDGRVDRRGDGDAG